MKSHWINDPITSNLPSGSVCGTLLQEVYERRQKFEESNVSIEFVDDFVALGSRFTLT